MRAFKTRSNEIITALVLAGMTFLIGGCTPGNEKSSSENQLPVFKKVASSRSGITFNNLVDENYINYFDFFAYVYNGGGVGIGDINNDGLQDIYFTGNEVPNKLYLNEGNFKFKDITQSAGVDGGKGWDNGVTMVDINHDGLMDIYICKGGWLDADEERQNILYVNQGDLTFKEQAKEYGLNDIGYSIHSVFFDMDNDNDLDLFISNRPDSFYLPLTRMIKGKLNPPDKNRDKLYRNDDGKFNEIGKQAGITNNFGYSLSVVTSDLNKDGYEDIFVANDYADNDYLYVGQKGGPFKEMIKQATNHISLFSMGTDIADINNDGWEDIIVVEMLPEDYRRSKVSMPRMDVEGFWAIVNGGMHKQYMHNVLHLNQGNLFFSDVSQLAGISKSEWSWSVLASDFDNDGYRDIFIANGYRRDTFDGDIQKKLEAYVNANKSKYASAEDFLKKGFKGYIDVYNPIKVRDYVFRNTGGLKFEDASQKWGFADSTFSNGAAIADFDNDGDLDLVINNLDDEALLFENTTDKKNNFVRIKLQGPDKNRDGMGAKVTLYYGSQLQYFEQKVVRGYLSSNEPIVHFGVGKTERIDSISVKWLDGLENILKDVKSNEVVTVEYSKAKPAHTPKPLPSPPFMQITDATLTPKFVHKENEYDEYKDQVLLPHMFTKSGPFIATGDVNKDGTEDFYVGGAAGQPGVLYLQRDNKLVKQGIAAFEKDKAFEDMGSVFFDADHDGDLDLYVVSGGSEFEVGSPLYQDRLYMNNGKGDFMKGVMPKTTSSGSCVAVADFNGDGYMDLFRGGQVVPHQYPRAPRSYLFVNDKGKLIDKTSTLAPSLDATGMVNSAVWVDLNGDKNSELVVTGEWMPIRVFEYSQNKFVDVSSNYGLDKTDGWWNKLIADDLDGDGDMDLIAGNLGENYKFQASVEKPFEVFAKDFDRNGTNDIFLAKFNRGQLVPIRGRECTSQQMPVIAQKFPTYFSFAESDLNTIIGDDIKNAINYKAYLFSSVMLINDQGKFTIKKLPLEAQFSTVNGILVNDFDGDGKKDILIAGNRFDVETETTPADASPGLFLKGLGDLNFKSTKPAESGFFVPFNVKDMKALKTKDGWDILVSSNNDLLRVFSTR